MKVSLDLKKQLLNLAVGTFAGVGLFAFTLGTFGCFVGLAGITIIKAAETLNPYHRYFKPILYCGTIAIGSCAFVVGFGMAIADTIGEKIIEEELDLELRNTISNFDFNRPLSCPMCVGCKNYHGVIYNGVQLICAIHPSGYQGENNCPDKVI